MLPNGHVAVALTATPGEDYTLQGSDDMKTWTDIGDVVAGPDGFVRVEDGEATSHAARFYRLEYNDDGN